MIINGTLLGVVPIKTSVLIGGGALITLFTIVEPEASAGLGVFSRFLFWLFHIGSGMLGIVLASYAIRLCTTRVFPIFVAVSLTAVLGALITTPFYYAIDVALFPRLEQHDSWLDDIANERWWQGIAVEFVEVFPMFLMSWYVVNLPLFFNKPRMNKEMPPDDPKGPEEDVVSQQEKNKQQLDRLYDSLPQVIGDDIVAISSDLHYLNVHTTLGKTLVLGSLKSYAAAFADAGMLVHRSHWVAKTHIVRVHISGNVAYCVMSTGLQVPISRSKRKEIKEFFGQSAVFTKWKQSARLIRVK